MNKSDVAAWLDRRRENMRHVSETLSIFFQKYLKPVLWLVVPIWTWLAPKYKAMYQKMAYKNGEHVPARGAAALATLSAGTVFGLYLNIWYVLPGVLTFTYDAVAYNVFSYQTEKLYFSHPQWIEDEGGEGDRVLTVFSCKSEVCNVESSLEYRFRDSMYLNVVKWVTKFEPYDPADVAGVLIDEVNYCTATAYGKRFKPLDWYPYIYDIECTMQEGKEVEIGFPVVSKEE